jgi:hypothetical protein
MPQQTTSNKALLRTRMEDETRNVEERKRGIAFAKE